MIPLNWNKKLPRRWAKSCDRKMDQIFRRDRYWFAGWHQRWEHVDESVFADKGDRVPRSLRARAEGCCR